VMSLTSFDPRYIAMFLPLWALAVGLAARWLWSLLPGVGRTDAWVALLVVLMLPATVPALVRAGREGRALEVRLREERAALAPLVTPATGLPRITTLGIERPADHLRAAPRLMFSDTPDFVAWTTGRPTVWVTSADYQRLPGPASAVRRSPTGRVMASQAALSDTLPSRGEPKDTWFHADPAH